MVQNRTAVVIEDDDDIALLVSTTLEGAGFDVATARSGPDGIELVRDRRPDVITLDVGLPGIDGVETTRRIRQFSNAHIVMLTGRSDEADVLMALDAGADDYVTKPFRPRELRARIAAMLRRRDAGEAADPAPGDAAAASSNTANTASPSNAAPSPDTEPLRVIEHNGLRLGIDERTAHVDGEPVTLTRTEFDLLERILSGQSRVRTKAELVRHLRDEEYSVDSYVSAADERALEVHVGNLRRKLGEDAKSPRWIETVRGVGYRLARAR